LLCVVQIFKFLIWIWRFEFSIDEISIVNFTHFQVKTFRPVSFHPFVSFRILSTHPRPTSCCAPQHHRRETLPLPKCQLHAQGLRIAGMSCPLSAGTLCSQSSQMGSTNQWRLCNQVSFSDGVKHLTHVPVREARQVPNSSEMLVLCPRLTWLLTPFKPTIVKKIKTIHFLSRLVSIPAESVTLWYLANSSGYIQ